MKRIISLLTSAILVAAATAFVACGGDDEPTPPQNQPATVSDYILAAGSVDAYYYGDRFGWNRDFYYLIMLDNAAEPTKMIYLEMLAPMEGFNGAMPEGSYPLILPADLNKAQQNGTLGENIAIAGSVDTSGSPVYCYYSDNKGNLCLLKEGVVNISKSGTEYTLSIDNASALLVMENGTALQEGREVTVAATFTGQIPATDYTNVYQMSFPASTAGQLISYGDYYDQNLGVWQLTLAPQGEAGEGFRLLFLTESTSPSADISGNYIAALVGEDGSMQAGAGAFVPGSTDESGIYGSYYMRLDQSGKMTAYDLAVGGEVTITKEGDIYTVRIAVVDNASKPQTLIGTWSGPLEVQQAQ